MRERRARHRYNRRTLSLRSQPIEAAQPAVPTSIAWQDAAALGVAAGVTVLAVVRRGAFFYPDSLFVGLGIATTALLARRVAPVERAVVGASGLFAAFWLLRGYPGVFTQRVVLLPMTALALVGAWRLGRLVPAQQRAVLRWSLLAVGCGSAVLGLGGVVWRAFPAAMPHDQLWRATGTFTYANALGLLLAMVLPLAMCSDELPPRLQRLITFVVAAGLAATLSRGGFVGAGAALLLVRPGRTKPWHALVIGGIAGVIAVLAGGAVGVVALALSGAVAALEVPLTKRVATVGGVAIAAAALIVLGTSLHSRLDGGLARWDEWTTAARVFAHHPLLGEGAERFVAVDRSQMTFFAHNEYLQVAAGGGVVAMLLLAGVVTSIARAVRRVPVEAWAAAGLVAFAVGGAFDFTWHLPAIGALAGWLWAAGGQSE